MRNKKTYLVVTPFFPSKHCFVGSFIYDQLNEIRSQTDFNIEIIKVVSIFNNHEDYTYDDFKIKHFKVFDLPFFIFPGLFNTFNKLRFSRYLNIRSVTDVKYIHSHVTYPSAYISEDLNCKKIIQHHGLDVLQLKNCRFKFLRRFQKKYLSYNSIKTLNKFDLQIGVSNLTLSKLKNFKRYVKSQEYVLYNGVNTKKFYKIKNHNNNVFTIGCVANFWKIKDQVSLIKAVEYLSSTGYNIKLRLVGTGNMLKYCKGYVKSNKLNNFITFENEMPHLQLNKFYNQIDLFVLPSVYEALGCVYLESWATNTPFIGIKGQGISEILKEKIEMLANPHDYKNLANKITFFIENDEDIIFPDKYDIKITIKSFLALDFFKNNA